MSTFQAKVIVLLDKDKKAQQSDAPVWQSPDGQRKIWNIGVEVNGKQGVVKTYSGKIASVGWEGTVESYEKNGDTFFKQPQQEGFGQPQPQMSSTSGSGPAPSASTTAYQPKDEVGIKAMWAIGQASSLFGTYGTNADLSKIEGIATELFAMVDRVKTGKPAVEDLTQNEPAPSNDELNAVFGDTESFDAPDNTPWLSQ